MEILQNQEWIFLLIAAFAAGFVDSVIGGGGLIQLPALLTALPGSEFSIVMGTNKLAGFSGTAVATIQYLRKSKIILRAILPAAFTAIPAALLGARAVSGLNKEQLKPIILFLFVMVFIYTLIKKDFGVRPPKSVSDQKMFLLSLLTGLIIGFYDGFFGPGTGSFLVFTYVILFGFEFMQASAHAKLLNCICNISALLFFVWNGDVNYNIAVPLAACNITGSFVGSHLALKKGSAFIRIFFIGAVSLFIVKMSWEIFL